MYVALIFTAVKKAKVLRLKLSTTIFHTYFTFLSTINNHAQYYIGQGDRGCTQIQGPHFAFVA